MYDACARSPEPYVILGRYRAQEVIDLLVGRHSRRQVLIRTYVGLYEVVAMHRSRHRHTVLSGIHELQQRHLRSSILHRHAVGTEIHVVGSALIWLQSVHIV